MPLGFSILFQDACPAQNFKAFSGFLAARTTDPFGCGVLSRVLSAEAFAGYPDGGG